MIEFSLVLDFGFNRTVWLTRKEGSSEESGSVLVADFPPA